MAGTKCKVLDTRKTTPGLRTLEKKAAAAGGVTNHRQGLFDAILIKNNHISAAGGVTAALKNAAEFGLPVEIEVRSEAELQDALAAGAKQLLLDNLTTAEASRWIGIIDGRATVELVGQHYARDGSSLCVNGCGFRFFRVDHTFGASGGPQLPAYSSLND